MSGSMCGDNKEYTKRCPSCKIVKSFFQFHKATGRKYNLGIYCKKCCAKKDKERNDINKEKLKIRNRQYNEINKEKISKRKKKYYINNRVELIKKSHNRTKKYRKNNIQRRVGDNLRNRLHAALKGNYKSGSAVRDLGCSIEEFKKHIEELWQAGMTWGNYGKFGWHIDHIIPLSSFDLTNREQFLKACHYTNLQPLWAEDNLKKGNKIIK